MLTELPLEPSLEARLKPRLGMRYGPAWYLKAGSLFWEGQDTEAVANLKAPGLTPGKPSLAAAVNGIHTCYGTNLVMGTDPEFFLSQNGQVVPAFEHLPDKYTTADGLFWDGFQAETVVDPFKRPSGERNTAPYCHSLLAQNLGQQIQRLALKGLNVAAIPVWRVPNSMLAWASEAHVSLGCDPSRNVYGTFGRVVERPRELQWRFAGGHVHFNLTAEERCNPDNIRYLVKTLDALLGIPSVCLAQNYDHFIRRRYYGLAGEYRLPPHGLEYRTLSNFWLMHPQAFMLVFDLARHVLNIGRARLRNVFVGQERSIRDTINYCDVKSAKDFMHLNREFYTAWSELLYGNSQAFWMAIQNGLDKVLPNWGRDVVGAWKLPQDWRTVPAWRDLT